MITNYLLLIVGFVVLMLAADWLVRGASGLAKRLNVPNLVIGLTVVAFGTSAPELVVNIMAAYKGTTEIAMTNILGSNIINTLVILGITALVYPIICKECTYKYEIPLSILAGVMVLLLGTEFFGLFKSEYIGLSRIDAVILLLIFVGFIVYIMWCAKKNPCGLHEEFDAMPIWKAVALILIGLTGLIWGGHIIVDKAVILAKAWGIPEAVIGVTIVALGTSLPELATSVVAAAKHNTDLAIGNIIGSNIFNVFFVLGVSSMIHPLDSYGNLIVDASLAAFSSLVLLLLVICNRRRTLTRWGGIVLLLIYTVYLWHLLS
jgi:cation:H+ antiporter